MYEGTDLFNEGGCNNPPTLTTPSAGYMREGGEGVKGGEVVTPVISVTHKVDGEEVFTLTFNNVQVSCVHNIPRFSPVISPVHSCISSSHLPPQHTHTYRPDQETVCYVQDGTTL